MSHPKLPYTIDDFRRWLHTFDHRSHTVGEAKTSDSCPIAEWLKYIHGQNIGVAVNGEVIAVEGQLYAAPDWAIRFQEKVDRWPIGTDIGKQQALNLLTRAAKL